MNSLNQLILIKFHSLDYMGFYWFQFLNDHLCLIIQLPHHYCTSKYHLKYFLFQSYHSLLSLLFYFCLMKLTKYYLYFLKISYLNIEQNLVYLLINLKK